MYDTQTQKDSSLADWRFSSKRATVKHRLQRLAVKKKKKKEKKKEKKHKRRGVGGTKTEAGAHIDRGGLVVRDSAFFLGDYGGLTRQQPGSSACCMEAASLSLFRRGGSPER